MLWKFTEDTYSAIPNKGLHKCLNKIRQDIRKDREGCKYCLKIDIKHYYQSIDHEILKNKYSKIFKDKKLLNLIFEIIDSVNTADREDIERIERNFGKGNENIGIPIGNYLSQYSGNLYLCDFDHWIKEVKKAKHYYRYMDDIVILSNSKEYLHSLLCEIKEYMKSLRLTIKNNYQIFPTYKRGLDFIGYRFFDDYVLLRKETCKNMKRKMRKIKTKQDNNVMINQKEWGQINSYYGILKCCDSYRLFNKYINPLQESRIRYYMKVINGNV